MPAPKMQHCAFCGEELGVYAKPIGEQDTCGRRECERDAREQAQAEREEAHEQLDRDMGY